MLTPQEVSSHVFTKALMGGYNMAMVDEFLDELTDDYTALYKENAALKAKMKVLVEKVEEYRATEDSMRATLLTAQKMADSIIHEAELKRDQLLSEAESGAQKALGQRQQELNEAEARLRQGQRELAQFVTATRALCEKELRFLERLPSLPIEAAPAAREEASSAQEIEASVLASFPEEEAAAPEPPAAEKPASEEPQADTEEAAEYKDPFATERESLENTRQLNLDELKFGRNYSDD